MQQTINLVANARTRVDCPGASLLLMSVGAAANVELWMFNGSQELTYIRTAPRGYRKKMRGTRTFTHVELRAAVVTTVELLAGDDDDDLDFVTGTQVTATIAGLPLQVQNDRGTPGNLLFVSGVSLSDAPATSSPDNAAVACSATQALIVAAAAARRQTTFTNLGPDPVALGSTGITWAKRCIILNAGESYVEDRCASLAFYAICDAAKTASVTSKEVLA